MHAGRNAPQRNEHKICSSRFLAPNRIPGIRMRSTSLKFVFVQCSEKFTEFEKHPPVNCDFFPSTNGRFIRVKKKFLPKSLPQCSVLYQALMTTFREEKCHEIRQLLIYDFNLMRLLSLPICWATESVMTVSCATISCLIRSFCVKFIN